MMNDISGSDLFQKIYSIIRMATKSLLKPNPMAKCYSEKIYDYA